MRQLLGTGDKISEIRCVNIYTKNGNIASIVRVLKKFSGDVVAIPVDRSINF